MRKTGIGLIVLGIILTAISFIGIDLPIKGYALQIVMLIVGAFLYKKEENSLNKVTCPRCLGKGFVNDADIKRLKKEAYWISGACAYCNSLGIVSNQMIEDVAVDEEYLVINLSSKERERFIRKEPSALRQAALQKQFTEQLIDRIIYLHKNKNLLPSDITDVLYQDYEFEDRNEIERWVTKILNLNSET